MSKFNKKHFYQKDKSLIFAIKNGQFKDWYYEFCNGHEQLLEEESNIICDTRFDDRHRWMDDNQIQHLIKLKVKAMYKKKFPNAKRYSLPIF